MLVAQFSRDEFVTLLAVYQISDIAALKTHVARWRTEVDTLSVRYSSSWGECV